jgi:hypothetical protein
MLNRLWDMTGHSAKSGWQINIRTYNIIPEDSLAFQYILYNNIEGLQDLFKKGKASPFDVNTFGYTLLCVRQEYSFSFKC